MEQSTRRLNDMENQISLPGESSDENDSEHSNRDEEIESSDENDFDNDEEIESSDENDFDNDEEIESSDESDFEHSDNDEEIESSDENDFDNDEEIESSDESDFNNDEEIESSDESDSDSDEEGEDLPEDETAAEYSNEIDWTDEVKNDLLAPNEEFVFDAGPVHDLPIGSTPLQFFKLFFTTDLCEVVKLNINKYAEIEQKRKITIDAQWKPIDNIQELWKFFVIIILSGINRVPSLNDYWANNWITGNQAVKKLMSRKRFQKILHYFCIVDGLNNESEDDGNFNFTQTVKPIMEDIRDRYLKHFKPPKELSISEALIRNEDCLKILQFKSLKPLKTGLKIWTLSSPKGYVFNFDICTEKNAKIKRSKSRLIHNVANHLLMPIKTNGHHIYLDRFFSSVPLMMDIFKKGHRACGCIRIYRKQLPEELKTLKFKEPGDYQHFQCIQYPDMLCCVCGYRNKYCIISTNSKMELVDVKMREGSKITTEQCPSAIIKYDTYMKKVKLVLPNQDYYNRVSKLSKWWRYLFWFLLDSCLKNAYIVYTSTNTPRNQSSNGFTDFKLDVIEEILESITVDSSRKKSTPSCCATSVLSSEPDQSPSTSSTLSHQKVKIKGKKQACGRCSRLKLKTAANYCVQSSYMCNTCQIYLCVSCFDAYHSENV
ncbi:PiggyBac transposable element-derived protein like [Argiope bruennichi]|uniref:PiggyBac transposable element-derived protein like n=1 Tax=Argiope bruennichi TaxID=94029 RepID=A0A8T0EFA4_ARGBR|nr:PiggyBac transposable element-derived protein like [Argiope bruennichi]